MTSTLKSKIRRSIASSGPIPLSQYMHLCNSHPQHGYYTSGNPLGKAGDFVTAPEISQMFGEMIAIWAIGAWRALGQPHPIQIAELGPGCGTLMRDFLRTIHKHPEFARAANIALVETSAGLKNLQHDLLDEYGSESGGPLIWLDTIDQLPPMPTLFIANEFLDAIPMRQFTKSGDNWREICVGIENNQGDNEEKFELVMGPASIDLSMLPHGHENEPDGAIFETAPAREAIIISLAHHITSHDGAALLIDYGHDKSGFGDTFQAIKSHKFVPVLAHPGKSDLTSHVDFQAISQIAAQHGARIAGSLSQGEFLLKLGLLERAGRLGNLKSATIQAQIQTDVERLVSPQQMGELFKVFCLCKNDIIIPPF